MRLRRSRMILAIEEAEKYANSIIDTGETLRQTAERFDTNLSRVSRYVNEILSEENRELHEKAREVIDKNRNDRYMRGGEATRIKFKG